MGKKTWTWHNNDTDELVATTEQDADDMLNPRCPVCGKLSMYDEGTFDQDFMGNDIRGWWYICYPCHVSTPPVEGGED